MIVTLLVAPACSDSDDDGGDAAGTSTTTTTVAARPEAQAFCEQTRTLGEDFDQIDPTAADDPDRLRDSLTRTADAIRQSEGSAPPEFREDVRSLAGAFDQVIAAFAESDFDLTKVPLSALASLDDPGVQAAGDRLKAYREEACGSAG